MMRRIADSSRPAFLGIPKRRQTTSGSLSWQGPAAAYSWLIGRLSRVTTSGRTIPEIEGLRLLAIASVVILHISGYLASHSSIPWSGPVEQDWLWRIAGQGGVGVSLFFTLSGFVLGLPFAAHVFHAARPVSLRAYYLRRVTRLEPPYLATLLLFVGMLFVFKGRALAELIPNLLLHCCYLHNIFGKRAESINPVTWSLEIEVQFYVLAPLIAGLFRVRRVAVRRFLLIAVAAAAIIYQCAIRAAGIKLPLSILDCLQFFLVGFLLVDIYLNDWQEASRESSSDSHSPLATRHSRAWDLVFPALLAAVLAVYQEGWVQAVFLPPLLFGLLVATFRSGYARKLLTTSGITVIGGMCYTIYLIHVQIIAFAGRFTNNFPVTHLFWVNLLARIIVVGGIVVGISAILFVLIEKPCMHKDWPQRVWRWMRNM